MDINMDDLGKNLENTRSNWTVELLELDLYGTRCSMIFQTTKRYRSIIN